MPEYTANAQQVLRNGEHFADTHSAADAAEIVRAMQARPNIVAWLERKSTERNRSAYFRRLLRMLADDVRACFDEPDEAAPDGERSYYNQERAANG
ncbi:hypothetical protein [Rhizorhapis suberifaciens]|uniref:Uncharacterized protein n=1 Tax=Rhizorhapis suberifaciens TaxID=13656 RepID=A0A840HW86_9SPHN|nr:hypothetical protein [Rhizorhapis suberifaciens]MBB4642325.1 hypothetical protein [Rhizorhapis suberifaciens]